MPNGPAAARRPRSSAPRAGVHAPVSACASGAEAIRWGLDLIRFGRADVVVVGGTEACVHPLPMAGFAAMRAMSTRNDEPERASRPFDKGRDGFVLGEGAGVLVLERAEHAAARGARMLRPAGRRRRSPPTATTSSRRTPRARARPGRSPPRCATPGSTPADIGHVNAHATSTPVGDIAEAAAIRAALGEHVLVTATKSQTGHLLGAAGALESIVHDPRAARQIVPATANLDDPDDDAAVQALDIVRREPRRLPLHRRRQRLLRLRRPQHGAGLHHGLTRPASAAVAPPVHAAADAATAPRLPRDPEDRLAALLRRRLDAAAGPARHLRRARRPRHGRRRRRRSRTAPTPPSWAARWASTAAGTSSTRSTPRVRERVPVVGIWHSGGARLAEGVEALHAVGEVFAAMVRASGRVPQISVVLGPAAGGAAYGPALTDLVIMGPAGRVFVTGPDVVRSVTGEDVDMERLGGPDTHGRRSGVVHVVTVGRRGAGRAAAQLAEPAGRPGRRRPGRDRARRRPRRACCPSSANRAYDVQPLVAGAARRARRCRAAPEWAPNIVTALGPAGRPDGRRDRQQPAAAGRLPGLGLGGEGGPVRADVRRVRGAAGRARRRPGLPARASARSGTASSGAAPSCCTRSPRRSCRG